MEERPDYDGESATTFVFNPFHKKSLTEQKTSLPIHQYKSHVLYLLEHHQVVILVGETGSGKSTQVPQVSFSVFLLNFLLITNANSFS